MLYQTGTANGMQHQHATFRGQGSPFHSMRLFFLPLKFHLMTPWFPVTWRLWNLIDVLAYRLHSDIEDDGYSGDSFSPKLITVVQWSWSRCKTGYGRIIWCSGGLAIPPSTVGLWWGTGTSEISWDCPFSQFWFFEPLYRHSCGLGMFSRADFSWHVLLWFEFVSRVGRARDQWLVGPVVAPSWSF